MNNINKTTKTTRGRQKIEIKKIVRKEHRQVTFTKRRNGVFKKAAELCILTGAEVAVFVKSHVGRMWAFSHPDIGSVVESYSCGGGGGDGTESVVPEHIINEFNRRYDDIAKELAKEKRRKELIESSVANNDRFWWEEPIEGQRLDELESYVAALEELKNNVAKKVENMMILSASNSMHYSSQMMAPNPIISENSIELVYNHSHDSASPSSLVPLSYEFEYGNAT